MKTPRIVLLAALAAVVTAAVVLSGCTALDVVGRTAVTTFKTLAEREASSITRAEPAGRWVFSSPGGERFEWSSDFSGPGPDLLVSLDAAPYIKAGLDPARLPAERYSFNAETGRLSLAFDIGDRGFSASAGSSQPSGRISSAVDAFQAIVRAYRPIVGYHAPLDHYGLALGDGNMFEWARDMGKNDKDIVFVLSPAPLIEAGVDPSRVRGWVFAKVPVKDAAGKEVQVDKFLMPYNLL
jgi:hypothetical protein